MTSTLAHADWWVSRLGDYSDAGAGTRSGHRRPPHRDRAQRRTCCSTSRRSTPRRRGRLRTQRLRSCPTLRLRPLEFEPDLVRRDLYELEIENVTDPALHTLLRAKRDEIARQITALEDRDTARFVYGSLQLYGGISRPLVSDAEELLETIPHQPPSTESVTAGVFADAARAECERYRTAYPDFPSLIDVREDVSELMVSFGRLLIPEAATFRADRVEPLLHHEIGTHVVTYLNGARQPLTLLDGRPARLRRDPGGPRHPRRVPDRRTRTRDAFACSRRESWPSPRCSTVPDSWRSSIRCALTIGSRADRVVHRHPGRRRGGSVKDAIYLRGIARLLEFSRRASASTRCSSASSRWTTSR